MSKFQAYQASFTGGEMDPLLRGRTDLQQYYNTVATADNVLFEPQGGFSRRPGLRFLQDITADNAANGVLLIPFEFSTTQNFMIVATRYANATIRFRFYANQVLLTNINGSGNSYLDFSVGSLYVETAIDMDKVYFTQSADTLIVVNEAFAPFKVVRGANNTTWTVSTLTVGNDNFKSPKSAFTLSISNPVGNITPSAVTGAITLTSNNAIFSSSFIDQFIIGPDNFGRAKVVSLRSTTVANAVVEIPFHNTETIDVNTYKLESGYEDAWSSTRGWPRTCTFHEGRLYFGGSASEPATLFGSRVGDFFNFKPSEGLDDDAIKVTLSTDSVNAITALRSGRDLQIFTSGAEFFVPQADLSPITPSNITVKSATRRGSKLGIRPQAAEGGTLFVQRQGKALREMLFSDVELSYVANNVSLLNSHLLLDPQRMALRNATDTTEGDLLMIVNGTNTTGYRASSVGLTGTIAAYMLNRPQQIVAPAVWTTDGDFIDIGVDLDTIYTVVKRTVSSSTKYYLEVFDDDRTTDSALQYYSGAVSPDQSLPGSTTAGSLSHLEAKTVKVVRDDIVDTDRTVSSGNVTLNGTASSYVEVGLDFSVEVTTQPVELRLSTGSMQSTKRRILEASPILFLTQNVTVGGKEVPTQTTLSGAGGVTSFSGVKTVDGLTGFSLEGQVTISQDKPLFMTVLALDYKVSSGA